MKVRDILKEVSLQLRIIEASDTHRMVRDDLANTVVRAEEILSVFELRELLNATDFDLDLTDVKRRQRKAIFQPFKQFLANRWDRLKDYPHLHYTETYTHPINVVCLLLATNIAGMKIFLHEKNPNAPSLPREPLHHFELMMPGINFVNQVTLLNLHQQDAYSLEEYERLVQLHQFILDEDLKIIHVADCIEYAKQDLLLKHTSVLHPIGTQIPLNEKNSIRVRYHSKAANSAWNTIKKIEEHVASLNTIGGALRRLMIALRDAGVRGNLGGAQDVAARAVHQGIQDFYNYFTSLNPELQKEVYALKDSNELSGSFEYIFKKLLVMAYHDNQVNGFYVSDYEVEDTTYLSEIEVVELLSYVQSKSEQHHASASDQPRVFNIAFSCVDQMSYKIGKILGQKLPLFKLCPATTDVAIGLLSANTSKDELDPELTKLEGEFTAYLGLASTPSLIKFTKEDVLTANERSTLHLNDDNSYLKKFSRQVITTPAKLFQCLNYLRIEYHRDFIFENIKMLALNRLFDNANALLDNFKLLNLLTKKLNEEALDLIIDQMGVKKIRRLFATRDDLILLSLSVSFNLFLNILQNRITVDVASKQFENDIQMRQFIARFTESQKLSLCTFFKILYIPEQASAVSPSSEPKRYSFYTSRGKLVKLKFHTRDTADDEKTEEKATKRLRYDADAADAADEAMAILQRNSRRN